MNGEREYFADGFQNKSMMDDHESPHKYSKEPQLRTFLRADVEQLGKFTQ